jgi:hypothetical protein
MAAGSIKIPSSGETTPEYNALRKSSEDISPAIIPNDFVSRAHACGLIPTRNPSNPPLDVVLNEISRDPVNYYSLQDVVASLNVGNRFDKGIGKMEKTFQCKDKECDLMSGVDTFTAHYDFNFFTVEMKKYIPAGSSEDANIEPGIHSVIVVITKFRPIFRFIL